MLIIDVKFDWPYNMVFFQGHAMKKISYEKPLFFFFSFFFKGTLGGDDMVVGFITTVQVRCNRYNIIW